MQLGTKKDNSLYDAIKQDENIPDSIELVAKVVEKMKQVKQVFSDPVQITIEEKITLTCERDGGIKNMEIKGDLVFKVNDGNFGLCKINTTIQPELGVQFKVLILNLIFDLLDTSKCEQGSICY